MSLEPEPTLPDRTTPSYYATPFIRRDGSPVDLGDVIDHFGLGHWQAGAVTHICRAGRKTGESTLSAMVNALVCLTRGVAALRLKTTSLDSRDQNDSASVSSSEPTSR